MLVINIFFVTKSFCFFHFHILFTYIYVYFIGGNARDLAREKNQKKQQELAKRKGISDKGTNQGLTLEQRKQRYLFLHLF